METQDDSIDIEKLQRVALGLDSAQSQPSFNIIEPVKNPLPDSPEQGYPQFSNETALSPAGQDLHKSPSTRSASLPRPSSREKQYATTLTEENRRSPEKERQYRVPALPRPVKMGSADTLPSDTQVISQSVYDDVIRQNKEAANKDLDSNLGDRATFATLHEGDSGHIDLLAGFDNTHTDAVNGDDHEDQSSFKLGESSPMHYQPNLFPESQRFVMKTPATVVKRGLPDGLATGTPCASRNPLASDIESSGGIMALSQVFKATQAPSSPLVNGLQSDLMSDRPSPNLPIQNHPLAITLSSPLNNFAATFPQHSSDAQMNYISMKDSQAQRDRIRQERLTRSAEHVYPEDHSDVEFDKEPSFVERMARQKMIDRETSVQFAGLTAPERPTSRRGRQTDKMRKSPPEKAEREDRAGSTEVIALGDEPQEPVAANHRHGTSEEETEHEEESCQPIPRSQGLNSSVEEDKENCNDPSATPLAAASNAHGRLSQVLALDESPSPNRRGSVRDLTETRSRSHTPNQDEHGDDINRSSQILVVKDSQRSPEPKDDERSGNHHQEPWNQYHANSPSPRIQHRDLERVTASPTKQIRIQSSPPSASQRSRVSFQLDGSHAMARARSDSASSRSSPNRLPRDSSAPDASVAHSSNMAPYNHKRDGDKASMIDPREKSSSMPSRVAETPVQRPRSMGDEAPPTSIPETSPNHFQNEPMDQEDDDLPPVYPTAHERAHHSQPILSGSSSPVKNVFNSKILSSPSGRQRRALTEIAADASPQVGLGPFDVDISILSADDREFRSAVAMSPIPPRKKRRGNDGQNVYASDPIVPVTPRPVSHFASLQENKTAAIEEPMSIEPEKISESAVERRSKPSRRMDTVWEMDDTPQFHVSRKERSRLLARSRQQEKKPEKVQRPEKRPEPQPAAVPNNDEAKPDPPQQQPRVEIPRVEIPRMASHEEPRDNAAPNKPAMVNPPSSNVQIAVNQILAPWSGQKRAYYPATCLGKPFGTSHSRYLVKFDDSLPTEVPMDAVKRLELRIGDAVKVDMPNVPKVSHIIRGFDDKISVEDLSTQASSGFIPMTDVYGHSTLVLGPKQRKSLPNAGLTGPENTIRVPISRIYMDSILWNQLKDRAYTHSTVSAPPDNRLQTPSDRHPTPTSPSTRLSRSIRYSHGMFSGMVFAVSYGDNNNAKSRITQMILDNDGRILNDGFNELFDLPSNAPLATPSKSPAPSVDRRGGQLRLTGGAEDIGFACLIADRHSRRPKYMQALALNLPCLSDRWVEDCVAQGRVLDWEMYLLPAGESSYLNGATKSRILAPCPPTKAQLPDTIAARPNLLYGQSVLIVMGRGAADEERRKAYLFLTYALGASRVERVPDLKSARAVLDQQGAAGAACEWDWIYVDNDEKASAIATILGTSAPKSQKSRKRKRTELTESMNSNDSGPNSNVRIVGNEFVCQSLIMGKLMNQ